MVQKIRLGEIQWNKEKITLDVFPNSVVYRNLRDVLDRESWDLIRKTVSARDGRRCRHCEKRMGGNPVYVVPVWNLTEERVDGYYVQRLEKMLTVCYRCMSIRRLWMKPDEALPILSEDWEVSEEEVMNKVQSMIEETERRRDHLWVLDLSILENKFFQLGLSNPGIRVLRNGMIEGVT